MSRQDLTVWKEISQEINYFAVYRSSESRDVNYMLNPKSAQAIDSQEAACYLKSVCVNNALTISTTCLNSTLLPS